MKGKKIVNKVKHCAVCQENFGDRFSFCPVCGEPLQAVQDNPSPIAAAATPADDAPREEIKIQSEPAAPVTTPLNADSVEQPKVTLENPVYQSAPPQPKAAPRLSSRRKAVPVGDGMYHLTMLQPPRNYGRLLMTGAIVGLFGLITTLSALIIYDMFNFPLDVAAVNADWRAFAVYTGDGKPMPEEEIERKNTEKGGGGGGGGKNDPKPASQGVDAAQTRNDPMRVRPSHDMVENDNFELKQQATTDGDQKATERGRYGIKNSTYQDGSDGPGRDGGQGDGSGGGQGGGDGTGKGNGKGSGAGNGDGDGNGNGKGDGDDADKGAPPPRPTYSGPAQEPAKILSAPRGRYTEEARKNNVMGTVALRLTLDASGRVTGVSVVRGLPHGLTESALAAARNVKFTPAKRMGQPVTVTKVVEFGFNIY